MFASSSRPTFPHVRRQGFSGGPAGLFAHQAIQMKYQPQSRRVSRAFTAQSSIDPMHRAASAAARDAVERLETRTLMTVSLDPNGYTLITPNAADRVVYVSSSTGSDSATGLSPTTPIQ